MRKVLLSATIALAAALCSAQDLSQIRVTYQTKAVSLKQAVQEIAALTGAPLDVPAAAANEIVIISVKDVPLSELMDRLAEVISGEWREDTAGKQWLNRSSSKMRQEETAERDRRAATIQEGIKQMGESAIEHMERTSGDGGSASVNVQLFASGADSMPAMRAIARITALLDPRALAGIESGERLVFATNPVHAMQRRLPSAATAIITDLVNEHNAIVAKRKAEEGEETIPRTVEQVRMEEIGRSFSEMFGFSPPRDEITSPPAKALLVVSRGGLMGMFGDRMNLQLKVYDQNGKIIVTGTHALNPAFERFIQEAIEQEEGAEPPAARGEPIQFSPITQEWMQYFDVRSMNDAERAPSPELVERLARPDVYDPLSFVHSEALHAIADKKELQVVANLPDSVASFADLVLRSGRAVTVDSLLEGLDKDEVTHEISDGWLVAKPAKPVEARRLRVDRPALAQLISAARSKEVPSLDDYASYALKAEPPAETGIVLPYLMLFAPGTFNQGISGMVNWDMLRFYGTLSPPQRAMAEQGSPIAFRSLSPQQRMLVTRITFGSEARLEVERPGVEPPSLGGFFDMISQFMPKAETDYRDEPTEILPNGLTGDGFLTVKVTPDMFGVAVRQDGSVNRMFGGMGVDEIAMFRFFSESEMFAEMREMMPRIERVRLGSRRILEFSFNVADGVSVRHTLNDDFMERGAPAVGLDNLPADFQRRVQERVEEMKKTPFPFGIGG